MNGRGCYQRYDQQQEGGRASVELRGYLPRGLAIDQREHGLAGYPGRPWQRVIGAAVGCGGLHAGANEPTLLLGKNINPKIVQKLLGHSTITTTLNTYSHVLSTMQDQAAQAMESVVS